MEYNRQFKDLVNDERWENQYIGVGNPNAKILIVGKECAIDPNEQSVLFDRTFLQNWKDWRNNINNDIYFDSILEWQNDEEIFIKYNPLCPFYKQRFKRLKKLKDGSFNGGTSNTARYVLKVLKAKSITIVARRPFENTISFEEANNKKETQVIINTTPVGMYPNNDGRIIDLDNFPNLESIVDVVYNPLRTMLCIDAKNKGLNYAGGLYMLVSQAIYAAELFHDVSIDKKVINTYFKETKTKNENIVLIGMPTSGKTTFAKLLKEKLDKLKFRTQIMDTYNRDIFKCGCGGTFEYIFTYNPLEGGSNDRQYRKNCINEMRILWLSRGSPFTNTA